ncbi:1-deoxy-D-xylulose-5-phosphate reductoisomerase [Chlamydia sp. 17-3921]|uniref:1-deoxy-D-xylulose-5-phosphate reductoisomerase n=1 Tax=Chlamydia sp. 17-3921 TaxID=2675798 RepID=UPI00191A8077|nr:1-deoxy-D-xylulose-5-phosphate reductoisomerase [Chlamydia sp. 17-3921]
MKYLAILGSTGSIGRQTLDIVRRFPSQFKIISLASYGNNLELLFQQIKEFSPKIVSIYNEEAYKLIKENFPHIEVFLGLEGLIAATTADCVSHLVAASSGIVALPAVIESIKKKKTLLLANKEILVCAGELISSLIKQYDVKIFPIDSEHNALFQCLESRDPKGVKKLILTASGGPFFGRPLEELTKVTIQDVLRHPVWSMGNKVTVDSSTFVNKALELIEAYWLFGFKDSEIDAVVHPQSLIHGMVEFHDGSILSVMNPPSMLFPIQYALTAPQRFPAPQKGVDFSKKQVLEFHPIDELFFPSIRFARQVLREKGSAGTFFNAANEILVNKFLSKKIAWYEILQKLDALMERHRVCDCSTLDSILAIDKEARALAQEI